MASTALHAALLLPLLAAVFAAVYSITRQRALLHDAHDRRTAALGARLRTERLALQQQRTKAARPRLELQAQLYEHVERQRVAQLRALTRDLDRKHQRAFEDQQAVQIFEAGSEVNRAGGYWHAVDADGRCPAEVPQWDWRLLLQAAAATDGAARESALTALATESRLSPRVLSDLSTKYTTVLANPEFNGILDAEHPECTGTRFASLEGDRMLRIDCDDSQSARYSLDDGRELFPYSGPVRIAEAESIMAFCGEEFNLLSHPRRKPELAERARNALPQGSLDARRPSVLVFMIDATSRAHFRRSMPKTLAALEAIRRHGAAAAAKLPLFCDVSPDELSSLGGERCVWEMFKRGGGVTMMAEEIHDACESATTTVSAVWRSAYAVQANELPDHQWWRLFCSTHIKPCCWAKDGFLNPGRRQCVGGGRSLHEVMIGYLEEFWSAYADAPRRWAAVNTMVAHEHFMLRLPSLDADLAAMLLRMAGSVLQDTVVLLLSDHGTHGIWYTEYEVGATEHQLPFLYMLAPDWLLRARPAWLTALTTNQHRLVTVHELYRAMRLLAAFPEAPAATDDAPSLFDELPAERTCQQAGIPEVYCSCRNRQPPP